MIDDFWNEAIKLADLHHPNVLAFYGVVLDGLGGFVVMVMEYVVNEFMEVSTSYSAKTPNRQNLQQRWYLPSYIVIKISCDVSFDSITDDADAGVIA
ncbi:hypothetical protein V6N12_073981 [Hibiscus sabdariffa]|uniref:Serine-threonine/tyrosine-protein kinase catalytic domain-containing protein n=1 Tax=Hibiscus sabdariffa TaxID=183260 RepID=A0ABR1ZZ38_9ROSI